MRRSGCVPSCVGSRGSTRGGGGGWPTGCCEPGSPWENPFAESFNSRVRDEHFNIEEFATLHEAQVLTETWRIEYNTYRPHSSLGDLTPVEYAATWTSPTQEALS